MIFLKYTKIRWLYSCLILLFFGCQNAEKPYKEWIPTAEDSINKIKYLQRGIDSIQHNKSLIQNGDIITRTGNDFTSQSLRSLNQRDKTFSHCGIASIENDTVFIYHALGGDFNPDQKLLRERFEQFCDPIDNNGWGIFRFDTLIQFQKQLTDVAKEYFLQAITFDMDFNLKTDDKMYCAEFVYKSIMRASNKKIQFPLSHIKDFEFIGVDDLFLHPQCKEIKQLWYK